jgi:hypothetical protein
MSAYIWADDVDDAPQWSSNDAPPDINKTSNKFTWDIPEVVDTNITVGVTGLVQEVISRPGWSSGNAQRFAFSPFNANGTVYWADYGSGGDVATLSVTWSGGDGGGGEEQNFRNPGGGVSHVDGANFQV